MKSYREELWFQTESRRGYINITPQIVDSIEKQPRKTLGGLWHVIQHQAHGRTSRSRQTRRVDELRPDWPISRLDTVLKLCHMVILWVE